MKVLHLLQSNHFSGAENVVSQIVGMFKDDANIEMTYCSRDGQIREALAERQISFAPVSQLSVREVKRVIREQKPDIIHAHDMRASFIAACACGKIPLVSHVHNNNFDSRGLSVKSIAYALAAIKARHIFWVSKSAREGYCFHKSLEKKSSVLRNIIDVRELETKAMQAENQEQYDAVFLGRLTYPKNPERVISVLERAIETKPDLHAAIIGTGELEEQVQQLIAEKKLQGNIHCLGFMSNPYGILRNAKVMLMTSRWEGLPMCALEAQALGVPIVSTPTDGLKELIEDGKDGFLSAEDQVLAGCVLAIVNNEMLHKEVSNCAREKSVRINNQENYISSLKQHYTL